MRRVCKVQPPGAGYTLCTLLDSIARVDNKNIGKLFWALIVDGSPLPEKDIKYFTCPFGAVGEELIVKESYILTNHGNPVYKADFCDKSGDFWSSVAINPNDIKWKSPVAMPREASRLTIIPERIWVEKVQEITEEGAIAEGFEGQKCTHIGMSPYGCTDCCNTGWIEPPTVDFMYGWDSHAKPGCKWADNPMVFVGEMRILK